MTMGTRRQPTGDEAADEALIEELVSMVARTPAVVTDSDALASQAGIGPDDLDRLFRSHYHTTAAEMLARQRVVAAQRLLLESQRPVAEIAATVGFPSQAAFETAFRRQTAMAPASYRSLPEQAGFDLNLPDDYPLGRILAYLGRDPNSLTERVDGRTCLVAYRVSKQPALVEITFDGGLARCSVVLPERPAPDLMAGLHRRVVTTLGLQTDPVNFEEQMLRSADLAPLIDGQRGLRVPLLADPFDGLIWAIVGQQINLAFAFVLRRRLIEATSQPLGGGLYAPPSVEAVAALEPEALLPLSFSRAKASYLVGAAQAAIDGRLPFDELADRSATRIERTLLAIRGIGPWSAHYLMMRHYGFLDCVPIGDTGLTSGLKRLFALEERPGRVETLALMERFRPYRSLATFHLWQRHGTVA